MGVYVCVFVCVVYVCVCARVCVFVCVVYVCACVRVRVFCKERRCRRVCSRLLCHVSSCTDACACYPNACACYPNACYPLPRILLLFYCLLFFLWQGNASEWPSCPYAVHCLVSDTVLLSCVWHCLAVLPCHLAGYAETVHGPASGDGLLEMQVQLAAHLTRHTMSHTWRDTLCRTPHTSVAHLTPLMLAWEPKDEYM